MIIDEARAVEHEKYSRCYGAENYGMGAARMADAVREIEALPMRGSYLDVSTGRGEMLDHAGRLGFGHIMGTEIVPDLIDGDRVVRAEAHMLPFVSGVFDVVSMLDVIEHLIPGDDALACRELARVARCHVLIAANNRPSSFGSDDLHINRRSFAEWDALFRDWFPDKVIRLGGQKSASEMWRIDF